MSLPERVAVRLKALVLILMAVFMAQQLATGALADDYLSRYWWLALLAIALLIVMASSYDLTPRTETGAQQRRVSALPLLIMAAPLLLGVLAPAAPVDFRLAAPRSEPAVLFLRPDVRPDAQDVFSLWRLSLRSGEAEAIFAPAFGVEDFALSPDGRQIAATVRHVDGTTDVWLVAAGGGGGRSLTRCAPASCGAPAWSPDGHLLAYERRTAARGGQGRSHVWLYDLEHGDDAPVYADEEVLGSAPLFSPDGSRLAMYDAAARAIRVVSLEGGGATYLPSQMGDVGAFSPDGSALVYADIRAVGRQYLPELWLATLGPDARSDPLRQDAQEDRAAAWSPDGRWIAFASRRLDRTEGWGSQLMLYDVETGGVQQATRDATANHTSFAWAPDGDQLLVQRFNLDAASAAPALWLYDLETGEMTLLVENALAGVWLAGGEN